MSIRDHGRVRTAATGIRIARNRLRDALPAVPGVPYAFVLPFYVLFGVFLAFPVVYTLYLSFFTYVGPATGYLVQLDLGVLTFTIPQISNLQFVGLQNYAQLLGDGLFWKSLGNTVLITLVQMPLMILTALGVALALDAAFVKYSGYLRTLIALPVSANYVAYSSIFLIMLSESFGLVNYALTSVGLSAIPWQSDPFWAKVGIAVALDWRWMGYNMLIIFAGLQNIPDRLYEAAEIDGASKWEKFRYVTLPQLRPILLFVVVLSTIGSLKLFAEPYVITSGGPTNSTLTVVMYIYREAFQNFNLGYASAITYALVLVITALSIVQLRIGGD